MREDSTVNTINLNNDIEYLEALLRQEKYLRKYEALHNKILKLLSIEYTNLFFGRYVIGMFKSDEVGWHYVIKSMIEIKVFK